MLRSVVTSCVTSMLICWSNGTQASPSLAAMAALLPAKMGATINIVPGDALQANSAALDAFNRAAAQWERHLLDPITIRIEADLFDLGEDVVNDTSVTVNFPKYKSVIRPALIADAADEPSNGIVAFLPSGEDANRLTVFLPEGFTPTLTSQVATANLKALGLTPDDPEGADGVIRINTFESSDVDFDFDNRDGVSGFSVDFETFAAREIGHVLGFISDATFIDEVQGGQRPSRGGQIALTPMDLFRFRDDRFATPPASEAEFNSFTRSLHASSQEVFSDTTNVWRLSWGEFAGDGNPPDTWKDDALGVIDEQPIGIMDPTVRPSFLGQSGVTEISPADLRVLDLIGYDVLPILSSDLTRNGFVDADDLFVLLANWNTLGGPELGDLFDDPAKPGINADDLFVLLSDWTGPDPGPASVAALADTAVPEPSGLVLAVLATLGLSFYRRRSHRRSSSLSTSSGTTPSTTRCSLLSRFLAVIR